MDMQHGHGHAAWHVAWTCSTDMGMQLGHGHPSLIWASSRDMCKQHIHGHAAWTWTCSMEVDMLLSGGHHNTVTHVSLYFLFNFTVLLVRRPPMMATLIFSFELILGDDCQMLFLLQGWWNKESCGNFHTAMIIFKCIIAFSKVVSLLSAPFTQKMHYTCYTYTLNFILRIITIQKNFVPRIRQLCWKKFDYSDFFFSSQLLKGHYFQKKEREWTVWPKTKQEQLLTFL